MTASRNACQNAWDNTSTMKKKKQSDTTMSKKSTIERFENETKEEKTLELEFTYQDKEQFYDMLHDDTYDVMHNTLVIVSRELGTMTEEEVLEWTKEAYVYDILDNALLGIYGLEEEATIYDLVCSPIHFSLGIWALLSATKSIKYDDGCLLATTNEDGEAEVELKQKRLVKELVWEAFNGEIPEGHEVYHLNGDKTDNSLENLALAKK